MKDLNKFLGRIQNHDLSLVRRIEKIMTSINEKGVQAVKTVLPTTTVNTYYCTNIQNNGKNVKSFTFFNNHKHLLQLRDVFFKSTDRKSFEDILNDDISLSKYDKKIFYRLFYISEQRINDGKLPYVWISQDELSKRLKINLSAVKRATTKLKKLSYLCSKRFRDRKNVYHINYQYFVDSLNFKETLNELEVNFKMSVNNDSPEDKVPPLYNSFNPSNPDNKETLNNTSNNSKIEQKTCQEVSCFSEKTRVFENELNKDFNDKLNINRIKHLQKEYDLNNDQIISCIRHTHFTHFLEKGISNPNGFIFYLIKNYDTTDFSKSCRHTSNAFRERKQNEDEVQESEQKDKGQIDENIEAKLKFIFEDTENIEQQIESTKQDNENIEQKGKEHFYSLSVNEQDTIINDYLNRNEHFKLLKLKESYLPYLFTELGNKLLEAHK